MLKKLKAPLTAILLSSVAVVPAATVGFVASADVAIAKSDKAGGNGNGNGGKSKSGNSKGKSGSKASSSSSGGSKSRGSGGGLGKLLNKLTGKDKALARKQSRSTASTASTKVAKTDPMHPSNLGKMNGPLNANVNALIAHIKNGNTNGPIGGMAALAVSRYVAAGADDIVALNDQYVQLDGLLVANGYDDALGNPDLEAYLDDFGRGEIPSIEEAIMSGDPDALASALETEGFADQAAYEAYRDGVSTDPSIAEIDTLLSDLEGTTRPTTEQVDDANTRTAERTADEDYMLSIWNKGDGDDSVRSPEEDALLKKLHERLDGDGETLTGAIEEYGDLPEPTLDPSSAECVEGSEECLQEDELASVD